MLKQMKLIYAQGFSKTEKLEWKPVVFNNVVQSMRVIFDAMSDYSIEFENKDNEVSRYNLAMCDKNAQHAYEVLESFPRHLVPGALVLRVLIADIPVITRKIKHYSLSTTKYHRTIRFPRNILSLSKLYGPTRECKRQF